MSDYGARIRALLEAKGLNQVQLAQKVGMTSQNLNRIITGKTKTPREYNLKKICEVLDVDNLDSDLISVEPDINKNKQELVKIMGKWNGKVEDIKLPGIDPISFDDNFIYTVDVHIKQNNTGMSFEGELVSYRRKINKKIFHMKARIEGHGEIYHTCYAVLIYKFSNEDLGADGHGVINMKFNIEGSKGTGYYLAKRIDEPHGFVFGSFQIENAASLRASGRSSKRQGSRSPASRS